MTRFLLNISAHSFVVSIVMGVCNGGLSGVQWRQPLCPDTYYSWSGNVVEYSLPIYLSWPNKSHYKSHLIRWSTFLSYIKLVGRLILRIYYSKLFGRGLCVASSSSFCESACMQSKALLWQNFGEEKWSFDDVSMLFVGTYYQLARLLAWWWWWYGGWSCLWMAIQVLYGRDETYKDSRLWFGRGKFLHTHKNNRIQIQFNSSIIAIQFRFAQRKLYGHLFCDCKFHVIGVL